MGEPHESKLTDYLTEALAKSLTEEGRQSLLEERELVEAEAQRERLEALRIQTRPLDAPEVGEEAQMPPEVHPESRPDPILPVAVSVREHPARETGRLAFGGIVDLDQDLPGRVKRSPRSPSARRSPARPTPIDPVDRRAINRVRYVIRGVLGAGCRRQTSGRSAPGPASRGSHVDLPTRRLARGRGAEAPAADRWPGPPR